MKNPEKKPENKTGVQDSSPKHKCDVGDQCGCTPISGCQQFPVERPHSKDGNPEKFQCVICEKHLKTDEGTVYDAGYITITFHYGSDFDQMLGFRPHPSFEGDTGKEDLNKLLNCDKIEAHICDECFEKKYKFFTGFNRTTKEEKVI